MKPLLVDQSKCTVCGLCVSQCSNGKLEIVDGKVVVTEEDCIGCGHCYSICAKNAIVPENRMAPEKSPNEKINPESLMGFLRKRRSHRLYQKKSISEETISKLIEFARFAPTGTNAQPLKYLVIKNPKEIEFVRNEIMKVYIRFHKLMENPIIRFIVGLFDKRAKKPGLRKSLAKMVERYKNGKDPIFHFAPMVIFVTAKKVDSSTPKDDACYALYHMVLGAESLGISSCINGLSIIGLSQNRKLKKYLDLVKGNKAYACAGFGYPLYSYPYLPFRAQPEVKIL